MVEPEPTWLREAGIATAVGGVLLPLMIAVEDLILRSFVTDPGTLGFILFYGAWTLAALLLLAGLVGVGLRTWSSLGGLGRVALGVAGVGFLAVAWDSLVVNMGVVSPTQPTLASAVGFVGSALGASLLGLGFLRSRVGSRRTAVLLTAAFPLLVVVLLLLSPRQNAWVTSLALLIFAAPFAAAWVLVGRELLEGRLGEHTPRRT